MKLQICVVGEKDEEILRVDVVWGAGNGWLCTSNFDSVASD